MRMWHSKKIVPKRMPGETDAQLSVSPSGGDDSCSTVARRLRFELDPIRGTTRGWI